MKLFEDNFGTVTRDIDTNILTLTWSAQTADMTDEDFQRSNLALAILAAEHQATRLIVNVEKFQHQFSPELDHWRRRNILPIYNRAGVRKFAFVHGAGFSGPEQGGMQGEQFATRHYASREQALTWLKAT